MSQIKQPSIKQLQGSQTWVLRSSFLPTKYKQDIKEEMKPRRWSLSAVGGGRSSLPSPCKGLSLQTLALLCQLPQPGGRTAAQPSSPSSSSSACLETRHASCANQRPLRVQPAPCTWGLTIWSRDLRQSLCLGLTLSPSCSLGSRGISLSMTGNWLTLLKRDMEPQWSEFPIHSSAERTGVNKDGVSGWGQLHPCNLTTL